MNITKPIKVAIGIFTVLTIIFPFFIAPAFVMFFMFKSGFPFLNPHAPIDPGYFNETFPTLFLFFYPTMMCFTLLQLALQVFYIVLVIKNKQLTDVPRILFVLGFFFMPFIAMPIYFVVYFWKENTHNGNIEAANLQSSPL